MIIVFTLFAFLIDGYGGAPAWLRATVYVLMIYLYEPLSVNWRGGTVGHRLLGLEVRRFSNPSRRLDLLRCSVRILFKLVLGGISVLVSYLREDNRTLHDMICGSVVVYKDQVERDMDWS